ncbi:MAG: thioredoxin domain-containing protein, partial [Nitrospirota bacterium]|nr:thioredoxin domain-containing protein [Nitrospirota bacterium]
MSGHTNRLADETSPYLLQHANNPVAWYPWGEEALELARRENRPIFLSIGYSACHWCHVMAHESFESDATAEVMNRHFVNIKVDREERPDLDHIYQSAYQLLAGRSGGWPLSMFLTPDLAPFWGGTYFPGEARYGMPAFVDVLKAVADTYENKPEDVRQNAVTLVAGLAGTNVAKGSEEPLSDPMLEAAAKKIAAGFDPNWGGFGNAPKFPSTMSLAVLLRRWYRTGDDALLHGVTHTLTKMARGGIYDHLGGGFARYSVDEKWLVPHFEKMLYDNALLVPLYTDAWRATGNPLFAQVVRETLAYVLRDMTTPDGGFCAAEDADSEGEEGRFYVWRPGEIEEVLDPAAAPLFMDYYNVSDVGNFEGQNILWVTEPLAEVAERFGMPLEKAEALLAKARSQLLKRREGRVRPGRDDKVITGWNGLMISAFAQAGSAFGEPAWLDAAGRAADFALARLYAGGRLLRCITNDRARLAAYLDDYAFLAQGLLDLYTATGDAHRLTASARLM